MYFYILYVYIFYIILSSNHYNLNCLNLSQYQQFNNITKNYFPYKKKLKRIPFNSILFVPNKIKSYPLEKERL